MKFSKFPVITAILLSTLSTAFCDLVLVQEIQNKGLGMDMNMEITMKIKGSMVRTDMGDQMTSIINGESGEITTLMHAQKMVMVMKADQIKTMMEAMAKQSGKESDSKPDGELVATGKTETIEGYKTEEYTQDFKDNKIAFWVAKDYPDFKKILDQMNANSKMMSGMGPVSDISQIDASKLPGMPIRTVVQMPGGGTVTSLLKSAKEGNVPASEFVVPEGYKSMAMPTLGTPQPQE